MMKIFKKLREKKELKKKIQCMKDDGRYVAPDGTVSFDSTRWVSPTKMRKYC